MIKKNMFIFGIFFMYELLIFLVLKWVRYEVKCEMIGKYVVLMLGYVIV